MATTGNLIRQHRTRLGLTAKQLADKVGTTQSTISRLESGNRALTQDWLEKISHALCVDVSDLLQQDRPVEYVPVIGSIQSGAWVETPFFMPNDVYSMPFPSRYHILTKAGLAGHLGYPFLGPEAKAFVDGDGLTWVVAVPIDKIAATNWIDKRFVVLLYDGVNRLELAVRTLERGSNGLYLMEDSGDPSQRVVRFDDPNVREMWLVSWILQMC